MPSARLKLVIFSLTPAVLLFTCAEALVRTSGLDAPSIRTVPLPEEAAGLSRPDPDLFWSLRPKIMKRYLGAWVETNRLGLRSPEVEPRAPGELRILSLGESTTFGVGVPGPGTYTAQLAVLLQAKIPSRRFTAINAGVSAWSSFQSLTYLEKRGLGLEPDLILFYHEVNDYLPSSLRDSSNNEIGVVRTDKQLYESRVQRLHRGLLRYSALYRWFNRQRARRQIRAFNTDDFENPVLEIGLPDIAIASRLQNARGGGRLNEKSLGRRVSDEERLEILQRLALVATERNIELIVIHPSYQPTSAHRCVLTEFCEREGVHMLDAHPVLHPPGEPEDRFFLDSMHPNQEGHDRLAEALARFILENNVVRESG